jgi:hypothetical protein
MLDARRRSWLNYAYDTNGEWSSNYYARYASVEAETDAQKKVGHNPNCFNLARSDAIALDRDIPDNRFPECASRHMSYPT